MTERPKKPFSLAANPNQELENIRDKDNAAPEIPAPRIARLSRPNLAPPGMSGIKRNLPSPAPAPLKQDKELFKVGDLTRAFKPLVQTKADKDRDIDR